MTAIAKRVENVLSNLIDHVDNTPGAMYDMVFIQAPIWDVDYNLNRNTQQQMHSFYQLMHTVFATSRHVVKPSGWMWLITQDAFRPAISSIPDNIVISERIGSQTAYDPSLHLAATRFVADSLTLPLPTSLQDTDIWWESERRLICVRWSPLHSTGLGVTGEINPNALYILVTGEAVDDLIIHGWIEGSALKEYAIKSDGNVGQGYYVALSGLNSFGDLLYLATGNIKPFELMGLPWRLGALAQQSRWYLKGEFFLKYKGWNTGINIRDHESALLFSRETVGLYMDEGQSFTSSWLGLDYKQALPILINKFVPTGGQVLSLFTDPNDIEQALEGTDILFTNIG